MGSSVAIKAGDYVIATQYAHDVYDDTAEARDARIKALIDEHKCSREEARKRYCESVYLIHPGHHGRVTSVTPPLRAGYHAKYRVRWAHTGRLRGMYDRYIRRATPLEILAREEALCSRDSS